jgi:tetratricopeptide (TPR) repeat protein
MLQKMSFVVSFVDAITSTVSRESVNFSYSGVFPIVHEPTDKMSLLSPQQAIYRGVRQLIAASRRRLTICTFQSTSIPNESRQRLQIGLVKRSTTRFFSSFSSSKSDSTTSFDPLQSPLSTALLRQEDSELSPEELVLRNMLERYQSFATDMKEENDETTLIRQSILEDLQKAYMDLEYWEEALKIEKDKCQLYLEAGTDEYADSIHAQGKLYLRQEDFENSKRLYQEAMKHFESANNFVQQGHVLISMAGWYFFRKQLEEALKCLHQAEVLLDSNPSLLVKCLDNQGLIHRLWGEFDVALNKYQQALQVVDSPNNQRALQMHVADMYMALEESDDALQTYQGLLIDITSSSSDGKSLTDQDLSMQGVLFHNIATIHVDQGQYDMALEEFRLAIEIKRRAGGEHNPEMARTWNSLGGLLAGIFSEKLEALECFHKALVVARIHANGDAQTDPDVLRSLQNIATIEHELKMEGKG